MERSSCLSSHAGSLCTADAVLVFHRLELANVSYSIRMNHTSVPSGRLLLDYFSPAPDLEYQLYWFFANVQQLVSPSSECRLLPRSLLQGLRDVLVCLCPLHRLLYLQLMHLRPMLWGPIVWSA